MGIFTPSKTGDALGACAFKRMGVKERREYAKTKSLEEEKRIDVCDLSNKYREYVKKQRQTLGLEQKGIQ